MHNLLIIDDNQSFLDDVELLLKSHYKIFKAENAEKGLDIICKNHISVLLLDLQLPDIHGLEVLEKIHTEIDPFIPIIIITEFDNVENIVSAMRKGAFDFLTKDFQIDLIKEKIDKAIAQKNLSLKIGELQKQNYSDNRFIFASEAMKKINFEITKIANLEFDVLLCGDTGVGKDIIASQIYQRGKRKDKSFVSIPILSLSETLLESELFGHEKGAFTGADKLKIGKFEAANQGVLYLPEISNLSENIQAKLLHFMQYKSITRVGQDSRKGEISLDIQLIMATNENLDILLKKNKIREDFYYRISGVTLKIPPLKERKEDILPLAEYFLQKYSVQYGAEGYSFSDEVINGFLNYSWPGNVRELENTVKHSLSYSEDNILLSTHFPNVFRSEVKSGTVLSDIPTSLSNISFKEFERQIKMNYFKELLSASEGRISKVAELSGLTPQGVRKILKQLGLSYNKIS